MRDHTDRIAVEIEAILVQLEESRDRTLDCVSISARWKMDAVYGYDRAKRRLLRALETIRDITYQE